ncbi:hypothetical protein ACWNYL_00310 [Candidatus Karelsulcia muelleri]
MYKFNNNSEYMFFKILNSEGSNFFLDYIKEISYITLKYSGNILINIPKKTEKIIPFYITYIRKNGWKIKYISRTGLIFINYKKTNKIENKYLFYKKIFIYQKHGGIIPGLLIPSKKNLLKIDIGTNSLKETCSLGVNLDDKVSLQDEVSVFNKKYLLSNEISNKIGLFVLWEIRTSKIQKDINCLILKSKLRKFFIINYLVNITFLINNKVKIIDLFINKKISKKLMLYCKNKMINIKVLKKHEHMYYIINVKVKYLKTPIEMILKSEIEKIINLIINLV